jgi:low affinity Fe/Cu permease
MSDTPLDRKLSLFDRIADKVSFAMGRPKNIIVWAILVLGWTFLFAFGGHRLATGSFLPAWFTSQGYNFPLNLITTVAELFIGFLIGAASNRSERNLEDTLARMSAQSKQIEEVETGLVSLMKDNTTLTEKVKQDTALLEEIHLHVSNIGRKIGAEMGNFPPTVTPPT